MDIKKCLSELGIVLIVMTLLGCVWLWGYSAGHVHPEIVYKDSIITKDSIIIDSIYVINNTIETKIKYIEKEYNNQVTDIISNSDSTNYVIFSDYLHNYQRTASNN